MEYDLSYDDSLSLKQTLADLLRGMSKKQAYQELGQGIQNTAKVIPSVVESLGRGAIAQVPGTIGDISQLARQFAPETMQNVMGNRIAPTTEEILAKVPRLNPNYEGSSQHEMISGLVSPAMPSLLRAGAKATQNMPIGNMIAYHGTPHEIQGGFDISKVGTGEGAQAYGHGMYFAENPSVASEYANMFSKSPASTTQLTKLRDSAPLGSAEYKHYDDLIGKNGKGNLYKVDIPDKDIPNMLDWDKPLSQQPKSVQDWLKSPYNAYKTKLLAKDVGGNEPTGSLIYNRLQELMSEGKKSDVFANQANLGALNASRELADYGITGVRYLDEGSRSKGGTSNFVVFDPKEVKILEKNSKPVTRKEILEEQIDNLETTSLIKSKPTDVSNTFGKGAERIQYKDPTSEGFINVLVKPDGTASVLGLEVPVKFRGKGIGQKLQSQVLQDFPQMQGQVSSKAAAKNAYKLGRRPVGQPNATLDDVFKAIDENSSINLVSPKMQEQINKL